MPDIFTLQKSLYAGWVRRLFSDDNAKWKAIPYQRLQCFGPNLLIFWFNFKDNSLFPYFNLLKNEFYANIVRSWHEAGGGYSELQDLNNFNIRNQIIWGNENILHNGKTIFFENWIDSDLIFINDIFDENTMSIHPRHVLSRLNNRRNWISEIKIIRQSIPSEWRRKLVDTKIDHLNSYFNYLIVNGKSLCIPQNLKQITSKFLYTTLLSKRFISTFREQSWNRCLQF